MHDSTEGRCEGIEASAEERYKVDVRHVSEVSTMNGVLIVRGFQIAVNDALFVRRL